MATVRDRVVRKVRAGRSAVLERRPAGKGRVEGELEELRRRLDELDEAVQENRRLNRRLAELMDVVEELLLPEGLRDEELLRQRLEGFRSGA